jgi:beta-galactosidase
VTRYFGQIGKQLEGLSYKSGGPVIGVQIENEYAFDTAPGLAHLVTLKGLARDAGLDVPYYSATGWPAADTTQNEFIPVYGGYPEAPWEGHTQELAPSANFAFHLQRHDVPATGQPGGRQMDPLGFAGPRYPYATAELGGGNQITYHRRPVIEAPDVSTLAYTSLGSGANLLGYYMFAGGSNPAGRAVTLQESRASGYPNDCPLVSYDFYAPVGEWGQLRPSYHELRLLHLFLNDFGDRLAPGLTFLPDRQPNGPTDVDCLRWSVRAASGAGFAFLANYQRHLRLPTRREVQLQVRLSGRELTVPSAPFTLPSGATAIWPLNQPLESARLAWATVQPVCTLSDGPRRVYVFATTPGVAPELVFDAGTVRAVDAPEGTVETAPAPGRLLRVAVLQPGPGCLLKLLTARQGSVEVLVLERKQALGCWKGRLWGAERLLLSDRDLVLGEESVRAIGAGRSRFSVAVHPCPEGLAVTGAGRVIRKAEGIFTRFSFGVTPVAPAVGVRELSPANLRDPAPGVAQPGPLYGAEYRAIPGARTFRLELPGGVLEGLADALLRVDYGADTAALYVDGKLVADDFYAGGPMAVGLRSLGELAGHEVLLQLVPLAEGRDIYFEPGVRERLRLRASAPGEPVAYLEGVTVVPQYQATLTRGR